MRDPTQQKLTIPNAKKNAGFGCFFVKKKQILIAVISIEHLFISLDKVPFKYYIPLTQITSAISCIYVN